jgi:hypothetical protein
VLVKQIDQLGEIRQRAGQAVDLVDDNDVDLASPHVVEEAQQKTYCAGGRFHVP